MKVLVKPLTSFFMLIHSMLISMGISNPSWQYFLDILIFTLIIKLILLPLTIQQTKSSAKMTEFQPKFKELQDKYKNDPQKLQKKQMELQKELGINPMSGCLLMLIQFPIFIAMYEVIQNFPGFDGVPFLWLKSLGAPDKTMILPILSGLTQYFYGIMMLPKDADDDDPQIAQQKRMNLFMSIIFVVMLYKSKAALWLYWIISNLLQMLMQLFILKKYMQKTEEDKVVK